MTTQATVVPAKAGIQEILPEKSVPATEGSGFRLSPERRVERLVYAAIALSAHGEPVEPSIPSFDKLRMSGTKWDKLPHPLMVSLSNHPFLSGGSSFDRLRMSGESGNPSNRRSGESRNPGNPLGKSQPATEGSGFRLSPERRCYSGTTGLCCGCPDSGDWAGNHPTFQQTGENGARRRRRR